MVDLQKMYLLKYIAYALSIFSRQGFYSKINSELINTVMKKNHMNPFWKLQNHLELTLSRFLHLLFGFF